MIDAIYIAATGMHSEQSHIDTISNNLANLNTTAYKKSRVSFDDLLYRNLASSASTLTTADGGAKMGIGSSVSGIQKDFTAGDLKATDNPLDLAIRGKGFLEVQMDNGELAYTRNGALRVSEDGYLETLSGHRLSTQIQLPPDATEIMIRESGLVQVRVDDQDEPLNVGQLELADFVNTSGLNPIGNGMYLSTEDSGQASYSNAAENGMGALRQGFLEGSNVDLVEEMVELVMAQRAYEVNSQVIRASDEILRINNNLRQ